jgi:hypothetical protein
MRLLLAYGRVYVTPRPHILETLSQAAGLTPSGVSRAFGAKKVLAVGNLTGHRPAAAEVNDHRPDLFPGDDSRRRCTWGGSKSNPRTDEPKYAFTDKSRTKWACCDSHLPGYLRSRPGAGAERALHVGPALLKRPEGPQILQKPDGSPEHPVRLLAPRTPALWA